MDRDGRAADGLRAARLLNDVVTGEWRRFEEIEVVALMELNRLLAKLDGVTFLDIGAQFVSADGTIDREVMGDYLHPTAKGYALWAAAMEPTLRRLLGESDVTPR